MPKNYAPGQIISVGGSSLEAHMYSPGRMFLGRIFSGGGYSPGRIISGRHNSVMTQHTGKSFLPYHVDFLFFTRI